MCKNVCTYRKRSERVGTSYAKENTCASHNHGAQFFFWELRDAYFFLQLDSYEYEKRVELMYDINYQQTTKREAWFGTNSASTLCEDRAVKGLRFFVGASRSFFFSTWTHMNMNNLWS